jgi:hypothetical protein
VLPEALGVLVGREMALNIVGGGVLHKRSVGAIFV